MHTTCDHTYRNCHSQICKKIVSIGFVLWFSIIFYSEQVWAQSKKKAEDDLFKELEVETKSTSKKGSARSAFLDDFLKSSELKFTVRSMNHYKRPTPRSKLDSRRFFVDGRVDYKTALRFGSGSFKTSGWAEYGNQKDTYRGATVFMRDTDRHRHIFEFNEMFWTQSWDFLDATAGRKVIKEGIATLYSPTDRISPKDLNDPLNPKALGSWLAAADLYKDATTFTVAALPFFSPSKNAADSSRWSGTGDSSGDQNYWFRNANADLTSSFVEEFPKFSWKGIQGYGRIKSTVLGWDVFFLVLNGYSPYPVLRKHEEKLEVPIAFLGTTTLTRTTLYREHPRVTNGGTGFSTTYKKFEFHGEALYQYAHSFKDDHYLTYVGGATYTIDDYARFVLAEQIDWTLEYVGEVITAKQAYPGYERSSEDARPARNNILSRIVLKYTEKLRLAYGANFDFREGGKMHSIGLEYKVRDGLIARLHSEFFFGKKESYYGQWRENDRLVATLEYKL